MNAMMEEEENILVLVLVKNMEYFQTYFVLESIHKTSNHQNSCDHEL